MKRKISLQLIVSCFLSTGTLLYFLLFLLKIFPQLNEFVILNLVLSVVGLISFSFLYTQVLITMVGENKSFRHNVACVAIIFCIMPLFGAVYFDLGIIIDNKIHNISIGIITLLIIPFAISFVLNKIKIFIDVFRYALLFYIGLITVYGSIIEYFKLPQIFNDFKIIFNLFMGSMIISQIIIEYKAAYLTEDEKKRRRHLKKLNIKI